MSTARCGDGPFLADAMEVEIEGALPTMVTIQAGESHPRPLGADRARRMSTARKTAASTAGAGKRHTAQRFCTNTACVSRPHRDPWGLIQTADPKYLLASLLRALPNLVGGGATEL